MLDPKFINNKDLFEAVENGDLTSVIEILNDTPASVNSKINAIDEMGRTPLHHAIETMKEPLSRLKIIRELVRAGANLFAKDYTGCTPYELANKYYRKGKIKYGSIVSELKFLMKDKKFDALKNGDLNTVIEILNQDPESLNGCDDSGDMPLHIAAANGHIHIVEELLRRKARLEARNLFDATPFFIALDNGHFEIAEKLLEAGAKAVYDNGQTKLYQAAMNGRVIAEKILEMRAANPNKKEFKPIFDKMKLINAVRKNDIKEVKALLNDGYDNSRLLMMVDEDGNSPLYHAVLMDNLEIAKILIEAGANVNAENGRKDTPLHMASSKATLGMAKLLLQNKANPNATDEGGYTPLHWVALTMSNSRVEFSQTLMEYGADVNLQNKEGCTPLHIAERSDHTDMVEFLLDNGANPTIVDSKGMFPGGSGNHWLDKRLEKARADFLGDYQNPILHAAQASSSTARDERRLSTSLEALEIRSKEKSKSTPQL